MIEGKRRHRHIYWTNFNLPKILSNRKTPDWSRIKNELKAFSSFHNYNFSKYKGKQPKRKIARNLVDYEASKTILQTALNAYESNNIEQQKLF